MKKGNYCFALLLLLAGPLVKAQQQTRLIKGWEFVKGDLGGVWEAVRTAGKGNPESVPLWDSITLPHCINATDAVDPDVNYYQGPAWYRTQLAINNPYKNGRTLLHFEGSGQKTEVYIYTTKVAEHVGGYDEWKADITEAVAAFLSDPVYQKQFKGKIPVSVRTDNSRDLQLIPSNLSDFNIYGGIYRYLNLVYVPEISLDRIQVNTQVTADGKSAELSAQVFLYHPGEPSGTEITITLKDPAGIAVQQTQVRTANTVDIKPVKFTIKKPALWNTEKPVLYTLETTIAANDQSSSTQTHIGFRSFEFAQKGPFFLNGKRLLLRGTHRHEDHAGVAAAMTEDMMREEMLLMKEMGVNFIRLGHYQQSRIILDLCDSLGILVWEEIPWCRGGLGGEVYKEQARRMLTHMIEQHYNHPAVIIWGLGNENDWPGDFPEFDKEQIRSFMKELNNLSHRLDTSRKTAIRRCDFCKDIVDVYAPSIWAGWYRGAYTEYKQVSEEEFQKVDRFFHAEWGGDSHAGRHSENPDKALQLIKTGSGADERSGDASLFGGAVRISKDGDWSESYICNLMDWHLKEQETMPWLTGAAQWVFKDFSTPVRPDNPIPYMNQKGLVARDLTKKEAYYVFQSYWATAPMAHIYSHTWLVRWGDTAEQKMIKVYSNCETAELFVNNKSYGKRQRNSADFPAAGLRWNVPLHEGDNEMYVVAHKGKQAVTDSLHFQYQVGKWARPAKMYLQQTAKKEGIATIEVTVKDAAGKLCLDAAGYVRFSLAGDGRLLDNQGTSNGSRLVQLYNGRAVISVQTNGGKNTLAVKSEGLPTEMLSF